MGSGGGLDDRFDLIFVSEDILDNSNGISYITDSYQALGQDGDRFNQTIRTPFNPTIPDSIADALFFMSDHLPVIMDVKTDITANILTEKNFETLKAQINGLTRELIFNKTFNDTQFIFYDLRGKEILKKKLNNVNAVQLPEQLNKGVYIWKVKTKGDQFSDKVIIH